MSSRRSDPHAARRGFTLLECEVALIVLVLLVTGLGNLTAAHQRLLGAVDEWMAGEPTFFVARPGETAAVLGTPATMSADPPAPPVGPPAGPLEVKVLSVETTLDPPTASAQVELTEG